MNRNSRQEVNLRNNRNANRRENMDEDGGRRVRGGNDRMGSHYQHDSRDSVDDDEGRSHRPYQPRGGARGGRGR